MAVTYLTNPVSKTGCSVKQKKYRRIGKAPGMSLDQPGRLWFANLMHLFGVSHQTVYSRIRSGDYPKEDGMDGNRRFWKTSTIRKYLEGQD